MGIFSFVKAGGKRFATIKSVKPKVNKTKLDKAKSKLAIQTQKTKASGAKLDQTLFESKNKAFKGNDFTFSPNTKKTPSKTELKDQADYLNKTGKYKVKKAKGGRVGLKKGTNPFKKETNVEKIKKTFAPKGKVKFDAKKSDLDKSGSLSPYEKRRGMAIAKAMAKRKKKVI